MPRFLPAHGLSVSTLDHPARRKRDFRALWIVRVSAACDVRGMSYSHFMGGLKKAGVFLNRKMLSEVAIADPAAFDKIFEMAKAHQTSAA